MCVLWRHALLFLKNETVEDGTRRLVYKSLVIIKNPAARYIRARIFHRFVGNSGRIFNEYLNKRVPFLSRANAMQTISRPQPRNPNPAGHS